MKQQPEIPGPFSVRTSGTIGQEILGPNGKVIAWTTEAWVGHRIVKLLNEDDVALGAAYLLYDS